MWFRNEINSLAEVSLYFHQHGQSLPEGRRLPYPEDIHHDPFRSRQLFTNRHDVTTASYYRRLESLPAIPRKTSTLIWKDACLQRQQYDILFKWSKYGNVTSHSGLNNNCKHPLTLQRGVTSTARHSVNITCRGVTSPARHAARSHSFVYISTS